ncbi:hypothetical protein ABZ421_44895, partial [Streptomyces sp. NPDC005859]
MKEQTAMTTWPSTTRPDTTSGMPGSSGRIGRAPWLSTRGEPLSATSLKPMNCRPFRHPIPGSVAIRICENGWPTGPDRSEQQQAAVLETV